jgi:hypothetical protein
MTATVEEPNELGRTSERLHPSMGQAFTLVAVGLAIILVLAALGGPWFAVVTRTTSTNSTAVDDRGYGITGFSGTDTVPGLRAGVSGNYLPWPAVRSALVWTQVLIASVLILGFPVLVLTLIGAARSRPVRLAPILGFAAGTLTLITPIVYALTFPVAAQLDGLFDFGASFVGSVSMQNPDATVVRTWGPGWAWIGLLIAGVLLLTSSGRGIYVSRRRSRTPGSSG